MKIKSIRRININNLKDKTVFLRSDLNVTVKNGKIKEDFKIVSCLPTIRFLLRYKCKIIISSHLGNPKISKKSKAKTQNFSTKIIGQKLSKLLGKRVKFIDDCIGAKVEKEVKKLKEGEILMLENLRFYKEEEKNNKHFAKNLAKLAEIYVNDAFAVSHREHASVSAIKEFLPSYAGLLLEKEVLSLAKILKPKKPLIAVMGGTKISTKLPLIKNFSKKAKKILVGGALANTFLAGLGYKIGRSVIDKKEIKLAKKIMSGKTAAKIFLPVDAMVSDISEIPKNNKKCGQLIIKSVRDVKNNEYIFDIGLQTIKAFSKYIKTANTIIWNGPMGKFEDERFKFGTLTIARIIAARSSGKAFAVIGGGETIEALKMTRMEQYIDWVSSGGGAMLAFLGGEKMPGLKGIIK